MKRRPSAALPRRMHAIILADGQIVTGTDLRDEAHAWKIALGWPDAAEIEWAKRAGARYVQIIAREARGAARGGFW